MCLKFASILFVFAQLAVSAAGRDMLADYASIIPESKTRSDGKLHLDTPATVAAVRALNANTYFYLVHGQLDWDDMRNEFLPAAAKAGLDLWLYFVPPTECPAPCTLPFDADYIQIAVEIAKLSLTYPNLKGMAIDDFADNVKLYTPEYAVKLRAAGQAVNSKFKFYPLLYWKSVTAAFLDKYAPGMDGMIFAYRDEPTLNTSRNTSLRAQLDGAEALVQARSKDLVLMVYCTPLGRIPIPPSVEYVKESVAMGLADLKSGKLTGVVTYKLTKTRLPAPASENYSHTGRGRATILASGVGIRAGSYGELSSRIFVSSGAPSLRLWRLASYTKLPPGYFFLQFYVDDQLAWEQDMSGFENKLWKQERAALGSALDGKKEATLRIRMGLKRTTGSIAVMLGVDDLEPEGFTLKDPGLEEPTQWTSSQTGAAYLPLVQYFDPGRTTRMFDVVKELYGSYQLRRNL